MARSVAALHEPMPELRHESGHIDLSRVAEYLGVGPRWLAAALGASFRAVRTTLYSRPLQHGLVPIEHALSLLNRATRNREEARAWLKSAHPHLEEKTPLEVILSGHADAVVTLLENAIDGRPA